MREKLIDLVRTANAKWYKEALERTTEKTSSAYVADYLLANGVIVPPCKKGDMVYEIEKNCLVCLHYKNADYSDCCKCTLDDDKLMFECNFDKDCVYQIIQKAFTLGMIEDFGKTVFLTEKEAQNELWRRGVKSNG